MSTNRPAFAFLKKLGNNDSEAPFTVSTHKPLNNDRQTCVSVTYEAMPPDHRQQYLERRQPGQYDPCSAGTNNKTRFHTKPYS